ncbi:MAG: ABC transporter ATP-binding protein [Bacteroidia bacterium]
MTKNNTILQVKNLSIGYNKTLISSAINFSLNNGELVGLFGENGKGKTTLLKTICGFIPKIEGDILLHEKPIETYTAQQLSKKISSVLTSNYFDASLYVKDVLAIARTPYIGINYKLTEADKNIIHQAVELCNVELFLDRKLASLSDGEKQRVMLARAITQQTDIIILDEPTAHLDVPNRKRLFETLRKLCQQDKAILISTHEIDLARSYVDKEFNV